MRYLRTLSNALVAAALGTCYVLVLFLQLNPGLPIHPARLVPLITTVGLFYALHLTAIFYVVLVMRQVLWPQREVMGRLAREEHKLMPDDVRIYFRDCYDHAVQALEVSENFREMASGLLDIYLTSLSHRLNDVMKVLTIISTVFMPLSFLAGVYGMNFDRQQPFNMPELGWRYGYLGFWGISVAGIVAMLWLFRRKGLL